MSSNNTISQTINYTDSGTGNIIINRKVEFVDIPNSKQSINITDPDFDLYTIFSAQMLRIDQKSRLKALDEFFKLHFQAIVVLDKDNLDEAYINDHEKNILRNIIDSYNSRSDPKSTPTTLPLKETPLGKKSLIEDNLSILTKDNILILFKQTIYNKQNELLKKTSMLITLFNQSKK